MSNGNATPRETWDAVKAEYQAGKTAPYLAEKYGVDQRLIYNKSCAGGWRRAPRAVADLAEIAAPAYVGVAPDPRGPATPAEAADAAAQAVGEALRAMHDGAEQRAKHCALLAESFARTALRLAQAAAGGAGPAVAVQVNAPIDPDAAERLAEGRRLLIDMLDLRDKEPADERP